MTLAALSRSQDAGIYAPRPMWYPSPIMATAEPSNDLPLADVFRATNELVAAGLIADWALGGALAAIYVMKPEMRQKLAREPFAEKVRKVAQLIRLAKTFPRRTSRHEQQGEGFQRRRRVIRAAVVEFSCSRP